MKMLTGLFLILFFSLSSAFDLTADVIVYGFELDKVLNLLSGVLSLGLFILTVMAYQRTRSRRLLFVSLAFLLFAAKGFLTSSELFFGDWGLVDSVASIMDFAILLSFFAGIIGK